MLSLPRSKQDKLNRLSSELLRSILFRINEDGSLGDGDQDVLTHHLLLVLKAWHDPLLFGVQDRAITWFSNIQDYRELKANNFNPFKLFAFTALNHRRTQQYVAEKVAALRKYHVKAQGYAVLQIGFTGSGHFQEVFPTLMAAELLLTEGSEESLIVARRSIDWSINEIDQDFVFENVSSIIGFAALVMAKYDQTTKSTDHNEVLRKFIEQIRHRQENGLWEDNKYQSCYVFLDLVTILSMVDDETVASTAREFLDRVLDPSFFDDESISGQNAVLVYSTLLRAFALLTNKRKRTLIVRDLADFMIQVARAFHNISNEIEWKRRAVDQIYNDIAERKLIAANPSIFTTRKFELNPKQVFVLMPYGPKMWYTKRNPRDDDFDSHKYDFDSHKYDFDKPYYTLIDPVIRDLGLECKRAAEIFAPQPFMEKIWREINASALIIADLTSSNPNVLYELGIAHTLGKPIIMMTQDEQYIPADLKAIEFITYEQTLGTEGEFREKITRAIKHTLGMP